MKILITGGLGFLGSHSIEKYKSQGFEITIIDNLSSNVIEPDDKLCEDCNVIIDDILNISWDIFNNVLKTKDALLLPIDA